VTASLETWEGGREGGREGRREWGNARRTAHSGGTRGKREGGKEGSREGRKETRSTCRREGGRNGERKGGRTRCANLDDIIDSFPVDMKDGRLKAFGQVRAVKGGATLVSLVGGEAELEGGREGGSEAPGC